jgi:hypothetical protein
VMVSDQCRREWSHGASSAGAPRVPQIGRRRSRVDGEYQGVKKAWVSFEAACRGECYGLNLRWSGLCGSLVVMCRMIGEVRR